MTLQLGSLTTRPVLDHLDLVASPVATALRDWAHASEVGVVEIDPALADTADLCDAADLPLAASANCVLVGGRRGGEERVAACMIPADRRVDVNHGVRQLLDVRKASFLPMERAVTDSGMEYGGITPVGLPLEWRLLVHPALLDVPVVVIGSGLRRSKLLMAGRLLGELPRAESLPD